MSKLNIIQKRELEPLMLKAKRIAKHYEKASNCATSAIKPGTGNFDNICSRCSDKNCVYLHKDAVEKAKQAGGSYIYLCSKGLVFWTSPFYSGERHAGTLHSGGVKNIKNTKIKSLAQLMLICADQITKKSLIKKNTAKLNKAGYASEPKTTHEKQNTENYVCPIDMERMLLACLRRGDNIEAQKILVKLLRILYLEVRSNFQSFRLKALELAVLLSRAAANPRDIMDDTALETTNRCLTMIEESSSFEEISKILCGIAEKMAGIIFSFHGVRHFSALRKAERYIWTHYTKKLSLRDIANASGLSAPYFSTVFKEEMGENLSNYLNRLRVEKAAAMLASTDMSINQIATACGFEDQSWFSKIFKNNTGFTPGKYRELGIHADGMTADENLLG